MIPLNNGGTIRYESTDSIVATSASTLASPRCRCISEPAPDASLKRRCGASVGGVRPGSRRLLAVNALVSESGSDVAFRGNLGIGCDPGRTNGGGF